MKGLPQIGGAVDGTHIPVQPPADQKISYYNHKGFYSIQAQIVCDHLYRIRNIVSGCAGRVHDAGVFARSTVGNRCAQGTLFDAPTRRINNCEIPVFLIADAAYPLSPNLMKPFSESALSAEAANFNFRLSGTRIVVENTIGRLKSRWRFLSKPSEIYVGKIPSYIDCCCTLHNLCEFRNDSGEILETWMRENQKILNAQRVPEPDNTEGENGNQIRNVLCHYLYEIYNQ